MKTMLTPQAIVMGFEKLDQAGSNKHVVASSPAPPSQQCWIQPPIGGKKFPTPFQPHNAIDMKRNLTITSHQVGKMALCAISRNIS